MYFYAWFPLVSIIYLNRKMLLLLPYFTPKYFLPDVLISDLLEVGDSKEWFGTWKCKSIVYRHVWEWTLKSKMCEWAYCCSLGVCIYLFVWKSSYKQVIVHSSERNWFQNTIQCENKLILIRVKVKGTFFVGQREYNFTWFFIFLLTAFMSICHGMYELI